MRGNHPELFILRHGQTEWNAAGRMQGALDSPLTGLGREHAVVQARILRALDLPADVTFHCSPQGRARQTAGIALAGLSAAVKIDDRLREVSVGRFEGLTLTDLQQGWPEIMNGASPLSWHFRAPGGESFDAFRARIADWLAEQTAPAVVVTDGMVSAVLCGLVLGLDIDGIAGLPRGQGIVYHVRDGIHRRIEV